MFVEPLLHRFENMLMLPSGDPPFLAGGTALFDGAALAGIGPVAAQDQPVFHGRLTIRELLAGGTDINVLLSRIAKVLFTEAASRLGA